MVIYCLYLLYIAITLVLVAPAMSHAGSSLAVGGSSAQVRLQFRIIIPQSLYLQVGQGEQSTDQIEFLVNQEPGSGRVVGQPEGIPVRVKGVIPRGQSLTLTVDSTAPLTSSSAQIPFTTISWSGTGDFKQGTFDGTTNQKIGRWDSSGDRQGKYTFFYDNRREVTSGIYSGQVTYTLSCP